MHGIITYIISVITHRGLPGGPDGKESASNAGDLDLIPVLGRPPWRRAWQSTPVFLPEEFHGQRNLVGYSTQDHKELDVTNTQSLIDQSI